MEPITRKQLAMLKYIARHIDNKGYQPSIRELGKVFNIKSPNGVKCHINALQRKGYVKGNLSMARCIRFNWKEYL